MHLLDQALLQSQWRESFVPETGAEPALEGDAGEAAVFELDAGTVWVA